MEKTLNIEHPLFRNSLSCQIRVDGDVIVNTVAYEHSKGIPARFCAGLIPLIRLVRILELEGLRPIVRIIDPSPIARYCNGWKATESKMNSIATDFLCQNGIVRFFFDKAENVGEEAIKVMNDLGERLKMSSDEAIADIVRRIRESGRRHGGDLGEQNAILYMAAHPFSLLDMYHHSLWKKKYPASTVCFNLMSKSEERFAIIRSFLNQAVPELSTGIRAFNLYSKICETPCYIPVGGEPTHADIETLGYRRCFDRYRDLRKESGNYEKICKDFRMLIEFLGL